MESLHLLLAFVAAASLLTVTPGVDTALVLRAATVEGRRPALLVSMGIVSGCLVWGAAVSLGLAALLRASEVAYGIVKFAGAAYLIWLGVRLVCQPRTAAESAVGNAPSRQRGEAFRRGLLTNLLNPKIGVFYVTFLPQFVPAGVSMAGYSFFLASIHALLTLAWFGLLIAATVPLGRVLQRPRVVKTLDRITGGVLLAFGVRLAGSSAP